MARYSEIYIGDELTKLRDGLDVLGRVVDSEALKDLGLWFYGTVTDPFILDIAKEAISGTEDFLDDAGNTTLEEGDIELAEIAIAIPISSPSSIDILYGRGYPLRELDFAYQSGEGEGIRTLGFHNAYTTSASIKISDMEKKALANSDLDLDEFLKDKGKGTAVQIKRKVQRDEEATTGTPHVPEAPKLETPQPVSKQTSLQGNQLSAIVEKFLG